MDRLPTQTPDGARWPLAQRLCWVWLVLVAAGCEFPGQPKSAERPEPASDVRSFGVLYQVHCAGCHGADGNLGPALPLNDPLFLAIIPDDELLRLIVEGRPGTPMPAFARHQGGPLTDEQTRLLAAGIKLHWKADAAQGVDLPRYALHANQAARPLSDDWHERTVALFARVCGDCHGANGKGPPAPFGAVNDPAFLALISDQALRRLIITGRPDLGMPSYAEKHGRSDDFQPLTSGEIDDLVALLATWRDGATDAQAAVAKKAVPSGGKPTPDSSPDRPAQEELPE